MRAARYHGPRDIRIEEIPEPEAAHHQVMIRIEWCGICGTDLHEYYDGPVFCPTAFEPHPLTGATSPVVLGHEFVGIVEAVGPDVTRARMGDRVIVEPRQTCGECDACQSGHHNCCPNAATIGLQGGGGGLAELIAVNEELVFRIGDLPADVGAVIEPLAVALHAVRQAGSVEGASAAVFGAGPIGLLVTWMLKVHGARSVILVEPSATRRGRGTCFGADQEIDPVRADAVAAIRDETGGAGVDVAFECAGRDAALAGCLESVRPRGTVINVAISGRPMSVDLLPLILKELRLVGTICYANDHQAVIDILATHPFPIAEFVTGRIDLADLVEHGIRTLAEDNEAHVKILVSPTP